VKDLPVDADLIKDGKALPAAPLPVRIAAPARTQ